MSDMTDPDIAEIARGLTKAQRAAIRWTRGDDYWGYRFSNGSARGIPSELKARWIDGCYLTPLGQQVRAHLANRSDDDA